MQIACVQTDVTFADPAENVQRVLKAMRHAGDSDLVVFPECMLSGYVFDSAEMAHKAAISTDSPLLGEIVAAAGELRQAISLGLLLQERGLLFNASVILDGGGIVSRYHKTHLPRLGVDRFVQPGEKLLPPSTIPTDAGRPCRVAQAICYDGSFPETLRVLAMLHADVVALNTNWPEGTERVAELIPPTRSLENRLFVIASNRVGLENGCRFIGRSSICGPDGEVLVSSSGDEETILKAEIDLARASKKTVSLEGESCFIDRIADRRPELYGSIGKPVKSSSRPEEPFER
ncbi:MAG: carbon-nitrogen hydrolase family protein [Planctomycetota bacterium]